MVRISYVLNLLMLYSELIKRRIPIMLRKRPHLIPSLIASAMLLGALAALPYGYYQLLRLVVCVAGGCVAFLAYNWEKMWAVWLYVDDDLLHKRNDK